MSERHEHCILKCLFTHRSSYHDRNTYQHYCISYVFLTSCRPITKFLINILLIFWCLQCKCDPVFGWTHLLCCRQSAKVFQKEQTITYIYFWNDYVTVWNYYQCPDLTVAPSAVSSRPRSRSSAWWRRTRIHCFWSRTCIWSTLGPGERVPSPTPVTRARLQAQSKPCLDTCPHWLRTRSGGDTKHLYHSICTISKHLYDW